MTMNYTVLDVAQMQFMNAIYEYMLPPLLYVSLQELKHPRIFH